MRARDLIAHSAVSSLKVVLTRLRAVAWKPSFTGFALMLILPSRRTVSRCRGRGALRGLLPRLLLNRSNGSRDELAVDPTAEHDDLAECLACGRFVRIGPRAGR